MTGLQILKTKKLLKMEKLNLLSRAEMKNVIGGILAIVEDEGGEAAQCQKEGDGCTGVAPGGTTKVGKCVKNNISQTLICEVN